MLRMMVVLVPMIMVIVISMLPVPPAGSLVWVRRMVGLMMISRKKLIATRPAGQSQSRPLQKDIPYKHIVPVAFGFPQTDAHSHNERSVNPRSDRYLVLQIQRDGKQCETTESKLTEGFPVHIDRQLAAFVVIRAISRSLLVEILVRPHQPFLTFSIVVGSFERVFSCALKIRDHAMFVIFISSWTAMDCKYITLTCEFFGEGE
jgi:hypothetical protein